MTDYIFWNWGEEVQCEIHNSQCVIDVEQEDENEIENK